MNEVIRQLYERKSTRVFTDQPIEESIVQTILKAATMAPTAGNQQLYTIIRVNDPTLLDRLADSCDHQSFIAKGKLVLVFCADCLKWYDAFVSAGCAPRKPGPGDLLLAVDDALIAAQNAGKNAEAVKVGLLRLKKWAGSKFSEKRNILGLPDYVFPAALLVFGYPTEQQKERKKPTRLDMKYIVHENRYQRMDAEQLKDMLKKNAPEGQYSEWIAAFCKRKYNSDFAREMSRSVGEYLKQYSTGEDL